MRIEDAYYKMARLRMEIIKFRKDHKELFSSQDTTLYKIGDNDSKNLPPSPEILKQFNFLKEDLKRFEKQLASYPYIYPLLKCWMIDVRGEQGEGGEKAMEEFRNDGDGKILIEQFRPE